MLICFWCTRDDVLPSKITKDHLIPRWARVVLRRYALAVPEGLLRKVSACQGCNGGKLGMPPALYARVRNLPALRKAACRDWSLVASRMALPMVGPWVPPSRDELHALQVAMSEAFVHNGIRYPEGYGELKVPAVDYQIGLRVRADRLTKRGLALMIDASTLSKQPSEFD